jgi:uncharacterized protein YndB with AHSA1/START domain
MTRAKNRLIEAAIVALAPINEVWQAWTTPAGVLTFFAPACHVDMRVDGPYEMYFNPEAESGLRGGEGVKILAIQPPTMLSFTWNAPVTLPNVRKQYTHVVIRLEELSNQQTQVTLYHDGWGEGDEWDQAYAYFSSAWQDTVLPRLRYRFEVGPVNWEKPPRFG